MRYYGIKIIDPDSGRLMVFNPQIQQFVKSSAGNGEFTYGSTVQGQTIANALHMEMDIPVSAFGAPGGGAYVRVWGISIGEIGQAASLTNKRIEVYGGMQKGLPLATAAFQANQAGLLTQGLIFPAFGNWIGTDMTLDLVIIPEQGRNDDPRNLVINWKAGTPLATALRNTLTTAFPGYEVDINISDKLVLAHDETGYYRTLTQLAQWVEAVSIDIVGGTYAGVSITFDNRKIVVFDRTTRSNPKQIAFTDLIGQPTWVNSNTIQLTTMVRADIKLKDEIRMPPSVVTNTAAAAWALVNQKAAFEGVFQVADIRHTGQFRNPDASAWVTTINCFTPDTPKLVLPPA